MARFCDHFRASAVSSSGLSAFSDDSSAHRSSHCHADFTTFVSQTFATPQLINSIIHIVCSHTHFMKFKTCRISATKLASIQQWKHAGPVAGSLELQGWPVSQKGDSWIAKHMDFVKSSSLPMSALFTPFTVSARPPIDDTVRP